MSIQKKIALLFFALNVSVILLLSGAIFYFVYQFTFEDFYKRLEARVNIAAQIYHLNDKDSLGVYKEVRLRYLERLPDEKQYILTTADLKSNHKTNEIAPQLIADILKQGKTRYKKGNTF